MQERMTNKRLVKTLMDAKGIEMISVTKTAVAVQVAKNFTPQQAEELCGKVGQPNAIRRTTKEGHNFLLFARF